MKSGHYLTRNVLHAYHFPNRVLDAKKLIAHGATDRADIRGSVHIVLGKCGALIHIPALYVELFRRNTSEPGKPVLVSIDDLHRSIDVRRNTFDQRDLILYRH